jgi:hypothetical protein
MKRRGFFGAMAGILGAPIAANAVTVTKTANDTFGEAGKLVEREALDTKSFLPSNDFYTVPETSYSMVTYGTAVSSHRPASWDRLPAKAKCSYCGRTQHNDDGSCYSCGAEL